MGKLDDLLQIVDVVKQLGKHVDRVVDTDEKHSLRGRFSLLCKYRFLEVVGSVANVDLAQKVRILNLNDFFELGLFEKVAALKVSFELGQVFQGRKS